MKLVKACIATAAFAAIFMAPSMASALEITHPTGTRLAVGTRIEGFNVAHATTPTQAVITTSIGNITCGTATLTGELTRNDGTAVEGNITTAEFAGTHGSTTTGHCAGSGILGSQITPTPSHTSDETKSLPWCMKFSAEDKVTLRGAKCSEASRPLTYTLHGAITCGYEAASLPGIYTTHPVHIIISLTASFSRTAGSSAFCPSTSTFHVVFTLSIDGNKSTPLYIR